MKIAQIKGYDEYGYEVMNFPLPTMDEATANLMEWGKAICDMGFSAYEAAEALRNISNLLSRADWGEGEITAIKDKLCDLEYKIDSQDSVLSNRIDVAEIEIDELRSALDAKTETPNQKGDLEIFSQIEQNPFLQDFVDLDSERPFWDFTVDF